MKIANVVLDTNIIVAALRSNAGASHKVMKLLGSDKLSINISVALFLEYEAVLQRQVDANAINSDVVEPVLSYIAKIAHKQKIHYLWRPQLADVDDDMVLELAVAASVDAIITFNKKDFAGTEQFNIEILTPSELLKQIGEL